MILKKRKCILSLITALVFSFSMVACTPKSMTTKKTTNPENTTNETTKEKISDNTTLKEPTKTKSYSSERIKKIEDAVNKVNGVKGSSVIITGDKGLVGINLEGNIEDTKTKTIKSKVEKIVKKTDKNLKSVAVSADIKLFTRISKVGEGLRSGKPFSEFGNEIEEIFRRILPQ